MSDKLLDIVFSEPDIWEDAILDGDEKKIRDKILKDFSNPEHRDKLKTKIAAGKYHVKPPHEAQVPKDDGTMRTVYANEGRDRVLLTVINNVLFKYCHDMIHPKCVSYQTGIGCGKIDRRVAKDINAVLPNLSPAVPIAIGYKIDLSKYFDSVPIEYIDAAFDEVEKRYFGPSKILDVVREYYHDDTLIALDGSEIHKYTSLRQGCAIAAFLADCVLRDIDETISSMDVVYYRYSDDILILGHEPDTAKAFEKISEMLDARSLRLNPKKVERLDSAHWFTFLGFSMRGNELTFSKKRLKNLQIEIERRTIHNPNANIRTALKRIYSYLYDNSFTKYGYAEGILPVVTSESDLAKIDTFILDCLRACGTGRRHIGGLGYDKLGAEGVVMRGKGHNVKSNRIKMPKIDNYVPITFMRELFITNRDVYDTYVADMMLS